MLNLFFIQIVPNVKSDNEIDLLGEVIHPRNVSCILNEGEYVVNERTKFYAK